VGIDVGSTNVRDEHLPIDGSAEDATAEGNAAHPAGQIRLSPARSIGLRVSALGGLAVGAIVAATQVMPHTTSAP
jgi:hypothetical protein